MRNKHPLEAEPSMQNLLIKLGLIDTFTLELDTTRETFIKAFQKNVDPDQVDIFEIFSNSKNHYKGEITLDTFKIKKRLSFATTNFGPGSATRKISTAK